MNINELAALRAKDEAYRASLEPEVDLLFQRVQTWFQTLKEADFLEGLYMRSGKNFQRNFYSSTEATSFRGKMFWIRYEAPYVILAQETVPTEEWRVGTENQRFIFLFTGSQWKEVGTLLPLNQESFFGYCARMWDLT